MTVPTWLRSDVGDAYFAEPMAQVLVNGHTDSCRWLVNMSHARALRSTRIGDDEMCFVAVMPMVASLDLQGSAITDVGATQLPRMLGLRYLCLSNTKITDKCIATLQQCRQLDVLDVTGTGISACGSERLKSSLPSCEIRR